VTLGAGAVFAGVGTGFLVSSLGTRSDGDELFRRYGCGDDLGCSDEEAKQVQDKDDEADKSGIFAITGFALGGAAIVTGLVLVVTAESDEDETQAKRPGRELRLIAAPGWLGAAGSF
jgi:hypothetical protein